jgi:hypothetical protein
MSIPKARLKFHVKIVHQIMMIEKAQGISRKRVARHQWIRDTYKTLVSCEECGFNVHPSALQFDHFDPSTKYRDRKGNIVHPSQMVNCSLEVMLREFSLCRIVCANCHAIHTHTVQRTPIADRSFLTLAA